MAGDWIKMRDELFTNPKFLRIVRILMYGESSGLLVYACGDSLPIGVFPPSNKSLIEEALRNVTEEALHDVTMCALLRVWNAVNTHCKVDGMDAVCEGIDLFDLDKIARFDGFGEAMREAGWVVCDDERILLRFPNFLEYNEPACLRKKPVSARDRVAAFRERQRVQNRPSEPVTNVTKCNDREEKRREEKKEETPLPPCLENPEFKKAWEDWNRFRLEARKKLTPSTAGKQLAQLGEWGSSKAIQSIEQSIRNGWQGLFEPHENGSKPVRPDPGLRRAKLDEAERKANVARVKAGALPAEEKAEAVKHWRELRGKA
jgi:hypothetical protein